jgi:hypothetical protein
MTTDRAEARGTGELVLASLVAASPATGGVFQRPEPFDDLLTPIPHRPQDQIACSCRRHAWRPYLVDRQQRHREIL